MRIQQRCREKADIMKILYITTIGTTMNFFKAFIRHLLDEGHTVDIATNDKDSKVPACYREWGCAVYQIDTSRSPFDRGNVKAIRQIRQLAAKGKYDIVHCHTPIAAMCTRLACRKVRKTGTKVIYTAHGFHFYKGAPLKNWLMYYPAEKLCAHFTDVLITINKEDYALAQRKMKAKRVAYVPGVGIDLKRFGQAMVDKAAKRSELGIPNNATLLLSVGELNANKNHETVIRAMANLDVYYMIAGEGELREHLQSVIDELGLTERVKLLGRRTDVVELYRAADAYVLPSIREGLNVSLMEAMASGLPVACGRIRGNTDLVDENGGVLFDPHSVEECRDAITTILRRDRSEMAEANAEAVKRFDVIQVNEQMYRLYQMN